MPLAKALERSHLEEEKKQPASATLHGPFLTRQSVHGDLVGVTITEAVKKNAMPNRAQYPLLLHFRDKLRVEDYLRLLISKHLTDICAL